MSMAEKISKDQLMKESNQYVIIDVREPDAVSYTHLRAHET